MEQQKEYFAFISYQRRDEKWADDLRKKLEHYRLPSSVRKQDPSLPKEIRPIFRDALELAGGVLADEIASALQQSKYLIVICSPNSAQSPWVNKEIQTFIDFGRVERIIPFIIDGSPFSDDPATECFPPALRSLRGERELLGININELGRDAAAVKVVARMFGLKFDVLWQRYEREKRRKRWIITGGILLFAIVALILASVFFNLNKQLQNTIGDRDRALTQVRRDSAIMVNHLQRIMQDSLTLAQQNDSIQKQYAFIEKQKDEIATERDKAQIQYGRLVAQKAQAFMDGDNYIEARQMLIDVFPTNSFPYIPEVEAALRRSLESNLMVLSWPSSYNKVKSFFSSDGSYIFSYNSMSNDVCMWDSKTGVKLIPPLSFKHSIPICFYKDNKHVLFESIYSKNQVAELFDIESRSMDGHTYPIKGTIVQNKKTILVSVTNLIYTAAPSVVYFYDRIDGSIIDSIPFRDNKKKVHSIDINIDNSTAAIAYGDTILLRDFMGKRDIIKWKAHEHGVRHVKFNPDGDKIVSCEWGMSINGKKMTNDTVKIWNNDNPFLSFSLPCACESALFSSDGSFLYVFHDSLIDVWNLETEKMINQYDTKNIVRYVDINNKSKKVLITQIDGRTRVLDETFLKSGKKETSLFKRPLSLAFTPNGKSVFVGMDSLYLYDVKDKELIQRQRIHTSSSMLNPIKFITIHNALCLINSRVSVDLIDYRNDILKTICQIPVSMVGCGDFNPLRKLIAINGDMGVSVWDYSTGTQDLEEPIKILPEKATGILFIPERNELLTSHSNGLLKVWKTDDFTCADSIKISNNSCKVVTNSLDGEFFMCTSAEDILICSAKDKRCVKRLRGHRKAVTSVQFAANRRYVVSTSLEEMQTRVWDVESCLLLKTYDNHMGSASMNPQGTLLVILDKNGKLQLHSFPPLQELIDQTREQFKDRPLTDEEKRKYYLE